MYMEEYEQPDMSMFGETTGMADVKLLVEERSIPVIKNVLCIASPVFLAMLEGDFKEKGEREIPLPGKKVDDVLTLLKCIYPDILLTVTEDVAFSILPLADEYQMLALKATCESILLQTLRQNFESFYQKDCNFLYKFLAYSIKYDMKCLKAYCVSLASDFNKVEREKATKHFSIPPQSIMEIDSLAISRFEIYKRDVEYLMKERNRKGTTFQIITSLCDIIFMRGINSEIDVIKGHMKGLRLAYAFENNNADILKRVVTTIREDQNRPVWCENSEYDLLSENIKRDINGVLFLKFQ